MISESRILLLENMDFFGKKTDLIRLRQAEIQISARYLIQGNKLFFDTIRHTDKVLRAVSQKYSFLCQTDAETVTREQFLAKFFFQCFQCFG